MPVTLPEISTPKCTGCGECVDVCHATALVMVASTAVVCDPERCDYCTDCEVVCPEGAIACPFEVIIED